MAQQVWLVTGGTGSLGTALTLKLLADGHKVRAFARNEHGHEGLHRRIPVEHESRLSMLIGDVRDLERLRRALVGVDVVIHAAALKIIAQCEYNPVEAVKTNVLGSINLAEAVCDSGVSRAVLISSDKAVSPANVYGATKMLDERVWLACNRYLGARAGKFVAVRWGNVWGSAGSVLHAFAHQRATGRLLITHCGMTRFHIRMEEAVNFVLRATSEARPGELWIPKMPSYLLVDLANAIAPMAEHEIVGIRPGEKLAECLINEHESCYAEERRDHYVLTPGRPMNDGGWQYTSGTNTWRLKKEELQREVEHYERNIAPLHEVRHSKIA